MLQLLTDRKCCGSGNKRVNCSLNGTSNVQVANATRGTDAAIAIFPAERLQPFAKRLNLRRLKTAPALAEKLRQSLRI